MGSGISVIVLAAGEGQGAGQSATTSAQLREQLDLAAALTLRRRIFAVVMQERRRRLESSLWLLPRSNVLAQPDKIGTAHGILLALLRISERDRDAPVVLLPSTPHVHDDGAFLKSLRKAAADAANKPDGVILLSVEPDATDAGIVVGRAGALLKLFEPELVAAMREIDERVPDARADPMVAAGLLKRLQLPYLDFHRHVLPGEKHRPGQPTAPPAAHSRVTAANSTR